MKTKKHFIIAIDGPAGSGKSTIAKLLAQHLNFLYIDSGAMYRAATLYLTQNNLLNKKHLAKHLHKIKISFKKQGQSQFTLLNDRNVTSIIRSSNVNKNVSYVSSLKEVRTLLTKEQRVFARKDNIIMDGRDIGTTVFPDAQLKIYLTASTYIRAIRRQKDLLKLSEKISIKESIKQIQRRDNLDSSRQISPLCKAQDAIVIDTSNLIISDVLNYISFYIPKF